MNKDKIIERLEMLSDLISETTPDIPNDKMLFHNHAIDVLEENQSLLNDFIDLLTEKYVSSYEIRDKKSHVWNKVKTSEI